MTDHLAESDLLASGDGQLRPDLEPVTGLAVDTLSTDLNLHLADQVVTHIVHPTEGAAEVSDLRQVSLQVYPVDKITRPGDKARNLASEISVTCYGLLYRLHGEVSVAAVHYLEVGDLTVTSQIDVLSTIGN